jgi:PIN domain nuclease of toxin-antitoxin system
MKILLDTHIFLWFISGDRQLSTDVRDAICDLDNKVYLSVVSIWECIVKYQLRKLPLPESPAIYSGSHLDAIQLRAGKPRPYRLCDLKSHFNDPKTAISSQTTRSPSNSES